MKKIKVGTVEILGYLGIILWIAVILLREYPLSTNWLYIFMIGILPNLAAAWVVTMFGKWVILFALKKEITVKIHLCLCTGVFILALVSEIVHDLFLNSPFDIYDVLLTFAAQIVVFCIPLIVKDKYFNTYVNE